MKIALPALLLAACSAAPATPPRPTSPPDPAGAKEFAAKVNEDLKELGVKSQTASWIKNTYARALCKAAGQSGPLHECSIRGSKEAGQKLWAMLSLGASKPWPDALEALTGQRRMDATALLEYFAPLQKWLGEQNAGQRCGW